MPPDFTPQGILDRCAALDQELKALEIGETMSPHDVDMLGRSLDALVARARTELLPGTRLLKAGSEPKADEVRDAVSGLYRKFAMCNSWLKGRDELTKAWLETAAPLAATRDLREQIDLEKQQLETAAHFSDILELCGQGKPKQAKRELRRRRSESADPEEQERIDRFLEEPRNFVAPVGRLPDLGTFNGMGFTFFGKRSPGDDGSFITTHWFCLLFIPIIPTRSYLVRQFGERYDILGRAPLSPAVIWWRRLAVYLPALLLLLGAGYLAYEHSDSVQETRTLARIEKHLAEGNDRIAVEEAVSLARHTKHPDRGRKARELGVQALPKVFDAIETPADATLFLNGLGTHLNRITNWKWCATPPVPEHLSEALRRIARRPNSGSALSKLIVWANRHAPGDDATRWIRLGAELSTDCDDPALLASLVPAFVSKKTQVPSDIMSRFRSHLLKDRYPQWSEHAIVYLEQAGPGEGRDVLHLRAEGAWKGEEPGTALRKSKHLPEALDRLLQLDEEQDLEKRAKGLESIATPEGLEQPQTTWHSLGVARRLSDVYERLNESDPGLYPIAQARTWTEAALKLQPTHSGLRATAMKQLLIEGKVDRVIVLGEADSSDTAVAAWLGLAYSRAGRHGEVEKLLQPIVNQKLPAYVTLHEEWRKRMDTLSDRLYDRLSRGAADRAFLARLNRLSRAKAQAEADAWVEGKLAEDSKLAEMEAKLGEGSAIRPAARELAFSLLMLGRQLPETDSSRPKKLEEAERLFLELRKLGDTGPDQQLLLGQVYFWLGKSEEGQKIFDRLEAEGNGDVLYELGSIYRDLFRSDDARRTLEAAYHALPKDERESAASLRALASRTFEEKLEWLNKADPSDPYIRSEIDTTRAHQHLTAGKYEEAVKPLKGAIAYYDSLPETVTRLNNSALLFQSLARATGDLSHLSEARRRMGRAIERQENDSIFLSNYMHLLLRTGYGLLAGDTIRADLLHELPSADWLQYSQPAPEYQASARQWAERPEFLQALELSKRTILLAPDQRGGYDVQKDHFLETLDLEGLRKLRAELDGAPPVRRAAAAETENEKPDEKEEEKENLREQNEHEEALLKNAGLVEEIRPAGHPATLAYALVRQAYATRAAAEFGLEGATLEKAAAQGEEALKVFPANPARHLLAGLVTRRAELKFIEQDDRYAVWEDASDGANAVLMLSFYTDRFPETAEKIRSLLPKERLAELALPLVDSWGPQYALYPWLWLRLVDHEKAEEVRQMMIRNGMSLESARIDLALAPSSTADFLAAWLAAKAFDDTPMIERLEVHAREHGLMKAAFGEDK